MSKDFNVPLGWVEQSEKHFNDGGFAGTVGSEQAEHFAAINLETDIVHCAGFGPPPKIFKSFRQATNSDDYFARRLSAGICRGRTFLWRDFNDGHKWFPLLFRLAVVPLVLQLEVWYRYQAAGPEQALDTAPVLPRSERAGNC